MLCQGEGDVFAVLGCVQAFFAGGGVAAFAVLDDVELDDVELDQGMFGALHVDGCRIDLPLEPAVAAGVA
jgi:hypothetical protein